MSKACLLFALVTLASSCVSGAPKVVRPVIHANDCLHGTHHESQKSR